MRLIDADTLEQIIAEKFQEHYGNTVYQFIHDFFRFVVRQIRKAPTIEAEPVIHSKWEITDIDHGHGRKCYHCPECGWDEWRYESTKRCPNCGAKMDGGAEC